MLQDTKDKTIIIEEVFGPCTYKFKEPIFEPLSILANNFDKICEEIDQEFEKQKENIRLFLADAVTDMIKDRPDHLEWHPDPVEFWDHSGNLKVEGKINLRMPLWNFLQDEYTGTKEATYNSGQGWRYHTYGDSLSYDTLDLGENIMRDVIDQYISSYEFSKDDSWLLYDIIHDTFYDNTVTNEFFFWEGAFNLIGINEDNSPSVWDFAMLSDDFRKSFEENNLLLFPAKKL